MEFPGYFSWLSKRRDCNVSLDPLIKYCAAVGRIRSIIGHHYDELWYQFNYSYRFMAVPRALFQAGDE
jgi:hypothetical protein